MNVNAKIGNKNLSLEILYSQEQQKKGFQGRPAPADDFGLFFWYSHEQTLGFWMHNVPYNLELLAFDSEQKLFQIIPLKAMNLTTRIISRPCRYVIEVASGFCKRHNVNIGDRLRVKKR